MKILVSVLKTDLLQITSVAERETISTAVRLQLTGGKNITGATSLLSALKLQSFPVRQHDISSRRNGFLQPLLVVPLRCKSVELTPDGQRRAWGLQAVTLSEVYSPTAMSENRRVYPRYLVNNAAFQARVLFSRAGYQRGDEIVVIEIDHFISGHVGRLTSSRCRLSKT